MLIADLSRYGDWANDRIFQLSEGLADQQLDQPRTMGFGSLRATLFHILTAERTWMDRWQQQPWKPFPTDPQGISLHEMRETLRQAANSRNQYLTQAMQNNPQAICRYRDSKQNEYANRLEDLFLHVANHGVHHRAQALSFLKQFGRTVPAGLDYLFWKLAYPTVAQEPASRDALRQYGLEVESGVGTQVPLDRPWVERYFAYHDWANARVCDVAKSATSEQLDRSFEMGLGSVRATLLHLYDAERWWVKNWLEGPAVFERSARDMELPDLQESWQNVARSRSGFVAGLDIESAQRVVTALAGGPPTRFRVIESLVQLCTHGTHHRAQLVNMLRQLEHPVGEIDVIVWLRN